MCSEDIWHGLGLNGWTKETLSAQLCTADWTHYRMLELMIKKKKKIRVLWSLLMKLLTSVNEETLEDIEDFLKVSWTDQLEMYFVWWKKQKDELMGLIWTLSRDFHLENGRTSLEASGIAHSGWTMTQVLNVSRNEEHWNIPHFQWRLCVLCLPVVSTPSMTINTKCAFYSTF